MDSSIIILSQEQRKELTTIPENISDYVMAKYYTVFITIEQPKLIRNIRV